MRWMGGQGDAAPNVLIVTFFYLYDSNYLNVSAAKIKFNFDENSSSDDGELELKDNEAVLNGGDVKQEIDDDLDNESFQ